MTNLKTVTRHHDFMKVSRLFHAFRRDSHQWAVTVRDHRRAGGVLIAVDSVPTSASNPRSARLPPTVCCQNAILAAVLQVFIGQNVVYPRNDLSYVSNFLRALMFC